MMKYSKVTLLSVALGAFLLPVAAQNTSAPVTSTPTTAPSNPSTTAPTNPSTTAPSNPSTTAPENEPINQQKSQQQKRIAQGLANGSLSTSEADALEKKQGELNDEERQMRAANGGQLTAADRAKLQQQQKSISNQIYQSKHNAAARTTDPKSGIGKTEQSQQEHIAQGMKSGQLTAGESPNWRIKSPTSTRNDTTTSPPTAADAAGTGPDQAATEAGLEPDLQG